MSNPAPANGQHARKVVILAAVLALAAGAVNAVAFFGFSTLVTNVTGHFASAAHSVVTADWTFALEAVLWVFSFAIGAFSSTALMLPAKRKGRRFVYALPMLVEALVLVLCVLLAPRAAAVGGASANAMTTALLFAMGLQNATITLVYGTVVRTTHLTGTLTDIGINASRYLFDATDEERVELGQKLRLHGTIAATFTLGALVGGFLFDVFAFRALLLPVGLVFVAVVFDVHQLRHEGEDEADAPS